jgi:hypothetical protein
MNVSLKIAKMSFGLKERIEFYSTCAEYLRQGKSIAQMVSVYKTRYKKDSNVLFPLLEFLDRQFVMGDGRLDQAFRTLIPIDEYAMLATVHKMDDSKIVAIFDFLCYLVQKKLEIHKSIFSFKLYLVIGIFAVGPLLLHYLAGVFGGIIARMSRMSNLSSIPEFAQFVHNVLLPFWINYTLEFYLVVISVVAITWNLVIRVPNNRTRRYVDQSKFYFPFYVYAKYKSFLFLLTAGAFGKAGFDLPSYTRLMEKNSNPYEKAVYRKIRERLENGNYTVGKALQIGWLKKETEYRLDDFANSKDFGQTMLDISEFAIKDVGNAIEMIMSLVMYLTLALLLMNAGSFLVLNTLITQSIG